MKKSLLVIVAASAVMLLSGCSKTQNSSADGSTSAQAETSAEDILKEFDISAVSKITVTSQSINDKGQLPTTASSRSASPKGKNISPQLSWDEVPDAQSYAIYMYDNSAGNWLHWMQTDITVTSLEEGGGKRHYIGPYPPSGKHNYEIVVYALKDTPDEYKGSVDQTVNRKDIENALDCHEEKHGNIIAAGSITGTVTNGVTVE